MINIEKILLAITLSTYSLSSIAMDQQKLEAARERASMINQVTLLLNDTNAAVRLSVFEEVMKDDDPVLRSLAMETAFSSNDERLKTAGLRQLFKNRDFLAIELLLPTEATQPQTYIYNMWRELKIENLDINTHNDEVSGTFRSMRTTRAKKFVGQLIRGGWYLDLGDYDIHCHLKLSDLNKTLLSGSFNCAIPKGRKSEEADGISATLPFKVRLS